MQKLRVPLHVLTQQQTQEENIRTNSMHWSRNHRSRNFAFVSGDVAATTGGRAMTHSSNQYSIRSSRHYGGYPAMHTQGLPTAGGERALTKNSDEEAVERINRHLGLVARRTEPEDMAPSWQKREGFSNTQLSLKAKALNLRKLNQKSRNIGVGFQGNGQAQTSRNGSDEQERSKQMASCLDLGDPLLTSRTVTGAHQPLGMEHKSLNDDQLRNQFNQQNIAIDNQLQADAGLHGSPPFLATTKTPIGRAELSTILPADPLTQVEDYESIRRSKNMLTIDQRDSILTTVSKKRQRVTNKKDIGKDPSDSAKVAATIFGDGDDSDLDAPEDLEESTIIDDSFLRINNSQTADQEEDLESPIRRTASSQVMNKSMTDVYTRKESGAHLDARSENIDFVVQDSSINDGPRESSISRELDDTKQYEGSTGRQLNDSHVRMKSCKKRAREESVEVYRDNGDSNRFQIQEGNSSPRLAARNSSEFSNAQSTILKVHGVSGDTGNQDHNSLYPLTQSFGGNEMSKFSIQRIDDAPYGQDLVQTSTRNNTRQAPGGTIAKPLNAHPPFESSGPHFISPSRDASLSMIHSKDLSGAYNADLSDVIGKGHLVGFELQNASQAKINHDGSSIALNQLSGSQLDHTRDAIAQAVESLQINTSKEERERELMQRLHGGKAAARDSILAQIEGRVAFEDRGTATAQDDESLISANPPSALGRVGASRESDLRNILDDEYDGGEAISAGLRLNVSICNRSLGSVHDLDEDQRSEQVEIRDIFELDIDQISEALEELKGPIEPRGELEKVEVVEEQPKILYAGPIFRYNYGFKKDFTERHLVLTMDSLKYYRNSQHAQNKKATNMPIVTVPFALIESIKEFKTKDFANVASNAGLQKKESMQRELYKNMFQIQLKEQSLAGGFYQLRQNEKVQDIFGDSRSMLGVVKEAEGKGLGALSHHHRSESRGLQSDAGFRQRSQSPFGFMFGKSLLERCQSGKLAASSKHSKSSGRPAKPMNLTNMKVVAEEQSSTSKLHFNESIREETVEQSIEQSKDSIKKIDRTKLMIPRSNAMSKPLQVSISQAKGIEQTPTLLHQRSAGLKKKQHSGLNIREIQSNRGSKSRIAEPSLKSPLLPNVSRGALNSQRSKAALSRNQKSSTISNSQYNGMGSQSGLTYSVSPQRLNKILKGPLIRNTRANNQETKTKSKSSMRKGSTSRQKKESLAPLLEQISASMALTQTLMSQQNKKSIKIRQEDLGSLFGQAHSKPAFSVQKKATKFTKQRHNWNKRLEQWEQGEKQLIFACENKEKKKKIIKIIQKIKKMQDKHRSAWRSKELTEIA